MFPPHARRENALAKRCATAAGPRCTGSCMQWRERTKNLSIGSRIIDLRVIKFFLPMFLVMFSPFRVQEASANRPVNLSTRSCVAQLRVDFARISPLGILVRQSVNKKKERTMHRHLSAGVRQSVHFVNSGLQISLSAGVQKSTAHKVKAADPMRGLRRVSTILPPPTQHPQTTSAAVASNTPWA